MGTNSKVSKTERREIRKETQATESEHLSWIERQFLKIFLTHLIKKTDKIMGKSWRTSLGGWGAILSAVGGLLVAFSNGSITIEDLQTLYLSLTGIGLFGGAALTAARDNVVTSKEAGAE